MCSPPLAGWSASRLATCGLEGRQQEQSMEVVGERQLYNAAMCHVQNSHPATVVHALVIEIQEVDSN